MESPEKLYTDSNGNNPMPKRYCEGDVEYVRTDVFIEKACEWLQKNASNYAFVDTDKIGNVADIDSLLVQDFKKYMKGNKI